MTNQDKNSLRLLREHVAPYDRAADLRAAEYDGVDPANLYRDVLPFLPACGAGVLDIGAGSGRDAQWFVQNGYRVVAIEPSAAFRRIIAAKSKNIDVRDGMLPSLDTLRAGEKFDVIVVSGVWQHVPPKSRRRAFNAIAARLNKGGIVFISLREGAVPADRKMYRVSAAATAKLARACGVVPVTKAQKSDADMLGRKAVRWTSFVGRKI